MPTFLRPPQFFRGQKSEKCLERAESLTETLATQAISMLVLLDTRGDFGFFGFLVLDSFEIGFSVFALKMSGFSVLVSTAVFIFFPLFCHSVFGCYE